MLTEKDVKVINENVKDIMKDSSEEDISIDEMILNLNVTNGIRNTIKLAIMVILENIGEE